MDLIMIVKGCTVFFSLHHCAQLPGPLGSWFITWVLRGRTNHVSTLLFWAGWSLRGPQWWALWRAASAPRSTRAGLLAPANVQIAYFIRFLSQQKTLYERCPRTLPCMWLFGGLLSPCLPQCLYLILRNTTRALTTQVAQEPLLFFKDLAYLKSNLECGVESGVSGIYQATTILWCLYFILRKLPCNRDCNHCFVNDCNNSLVLEMFIQKVTPLSSVRFPLPCIIGLFQMLLKEKDVGDQYSWLPRY